MLNEPIAVLIDRYGVGDLLTNRVLIVDDDEPNLAVLETILEVDHEILQATSGAAALALVESTPVDVVISDQRMPGMTGVELLSKIREACPDVAGVILTAYSDSSAIISAINRAGVFRFLTKPWNPDDVLTTVAQAGQHVYQLRAIRWLLTQLDARNRDLATALADLKAAQQNMLHLERLGTIGRLTAGVTHDLRNFLVGLAMLDEECTTSPDVSEDMKSAVSVSLGGLRNLVHTLETLNQFASGGRIAVSTAPIRVETLVSDALSVMRLDVNFRKRNVDRRIPLALPAIDGDRRKLTQVLVNLCRNAVHATQAGQTIVFEASAQPDGTVTIAVEDDGPGVPQAIRERMFEPFVTSRETQGMGMGLHMCRLIVESHRGLLRYRDRAGGGARFEMVFTALQENS